MKVLGATKVFTKESLDANDSVAKMAMESWLSQWGYNVSSVMEQPNAYGDWDIVLTNSGGERVTIECEVRYNVDFVFCRALKKNGTWSVSGRLRSLHFPMRKAKSKSDYFVSYSMENDALVIFDRWDVFDSPWERQDSQTDSGYIAGEYFFGVPWDSGMFFFRERCGSWIFSPLGQTTACMLRPRYDEWCVSSNAHLFWNKYHAYETSFNAASHVAKEQG